MEKSRAPPSNKLGKRAIMARDRLFGVIASKQSYEKLSYFAQAILNHSTRCLCEGKI